jgi:hypothetical protein
MSKTTVYRSRTLSISADALWERVGGWATLHEWHPVIASVEAEGEGVGSTRLLNLADGATVLERLESSDDAARTYSYRFVEHPLPVDDYAGTLAVSSNDDGSSTVTWSSTFEPKGVSEAEAQEIIGGIYSAGLDAL